jgi:peroxiredoxin
VTYPLVADHSGSVAAAYNVSSLPVTVVINRDGTIVARHQGALTDPQLAAVLQLDFQNLVPSSS